MQKGTKELFTSLGLSWQIPLRASREEVNIFFSSVCKVRNIDLILDPSLRVPKAVGYIEFYDPINVSIAVDLSGQLLLGQPIEVKPLNVGSPAAQILYSHWYEEFPGQDLGYDDFG